MSIVDYSADYLATDVCAHLPLPDLSAPRVFPVQIQRAATLLDLIQTEGAPSDRALAHAFRAERSMGKRDRNQLQVLVFFVLRYWRSLDALMDLPADAERGSSLQRLGVVLALADRLDDTLAAFKAGAFEVQDAGSQWIIEACQAESGMSVLDLCAGAGGKALGLAQAVGDTGRVLACDVDFERLSRLPERSERAGWTNIECQPIDHGRDREVLRRAPFDRVLIDAPCSGSGTVRRHPELKQAVIDLAALGAIQSQLLDDGAQVTRPDGLLIYATCSLWLDENEAQIDAFLRRHPAWRLEPLPATITAFVAPPAVEPACGMARIRPDIHGGDGFFFAVLRAPI